MPNSRVRLVTILGDKFDFSALTEVDDTVRSEIIDELPTADVARGVAELDSDDAVHILEDIDIPEREAVDLRTIRQIEDYLARHHRL